MLSCIHQRSREPLEFLVTCRLLLTGLSASMFILWYSNLAKIRERIYCFYTAATKPATKVENVSSQIKSYPFLCFFFPRFLDREFSQKTSGDLQSSQTYSPSETFDHKGFPTPIIALIREKATLFFREYFILVLIWLIRG